MRLDAKSIAALKLDGKNDVIVFDDSMPGFGYRLRRSAAARCCAPGSCSTSAPAPPAACCSDRPRC